MKSAHSLSFLIAVLVIIAGTFSYVLILVLGQRNSNAPAAFTHLQPRAQLAQLSGAGSSLASYWTFDEGSGSIAGDSVGSDTGTVTGAIWTTGKFGGALSFSGNSYVSTGRNPIGTGDATVCAWIDPTNITAAYNPIVSSVYFQLSLFSAGGTYIGLTNDNSHEIYASFSGLNSWQYVCGTRQASGQSSIYVNGTAIMSGAAGTPAGGFNTYIGGEQTGGHNFIGSIDDVRIYGRVLSASEIQSLYALGTGSSGGTSGGTSGGGSTAAPIISNVSFSNLTSSGVTISWTTDQPADTQVEYDTTILYGLHSALTDTNPLVTSHTATLSGLAANTVYDYRVDSKNSSGTLGISIGTFTTSAGSSGSGGGVGGTTRNVACSGDITSTFGAAINASVSGDTITIGAGSCSISNEGSIYDKNVTIIGAGKGVTNIEAENGFAAFKTTGGNSPTWRLSGISFWGTSNSIASLLSIWGTGSASVRGPFRIDHVSVNYPNAGADGLIAVWGPIYGLIDHNDFTQDYEAAIATGWELNSENCSYNVGGTCDLTTLGGGTEAATPYEPGGVHNLYIEDNTFTGKSTNALSAIDTFYSGGRIVFRHNTLNSTGLYAHWTQGGYVNSLWWEVYNNNFQWTLGTNNGNNPMRMQGGGTGLIYNNTVNFPQNFIALGDGRIVSENQSSAPLNFCNGTQAVDGNAGDLAAPGWPCLMQAGRAAGKSIASIMAGSKQTSFPLYLWNNGTQNSCSNPAAGGAACDNTFHTSTFAGSAPYFRSTPHTVVGGGYGSGDVDYSITVSQPAGAGNHRLVYMPFTYPYPLTVSGMPDASGSGGTSGVPVVPPTVSDTLPPPAPTNLGASPVSSGQSNLTLLAPAVNVVSYAPTVLNVPIPLNCPPGYVCTPKAQVTSSTGLSAFIFTRTLHLGMIGGDVKNLQIFLNTHGFTVSIKGAGSRDFESTYFGPATFKALIKYQNANYATILKPHNLTQGTGFFGIATMKVVNAVITTEK